MMTKFESFNKQPCASYLRDITFSVDNLQGIHPSKLYHLGKYRKQISQGRLGCPMERNADVRLKNGPRYE